MLQTKAVITPQPNDQTKAAPRRGSPWPQKVFSALTAFILISSASSASAQLFADNEARKALLDLRNKVAELDRKLEQQRAELTGRVSQVEPTQRGQLELANQLEQVSAQLAKLRGQVDQLTYKLSVEQSRARDLYTDLDTRLKKFEPKEITLDGQTVSVTLQEQAAYDAALGAFRASNYSSAAASLKSLLANHPKSAYAASAQYWLGNAYYQLKDYKAALAAQRALITEHPNSAKIPDALLNIAASQLELKDSKGAKKTLQRILKNHPNSEAAGAAGSRLKSLK